MFLNRMQIILFVPRTKQRGKGCEPDRAVQRVDQ